jgi:hypothetical protein
MGSQDRPPDIPSSGQLQPLVGQPTKAGDLRADDAERQYNSTAKVRAVYYPRAASMLRFLKLNPAATLLEAMAHAAIPSSPHPADEGRFR